MTDIENLNNIFYNIKNLTINFKNNYYVQELFSFGNIITNLVYLNLEGHLEYKINPYLFEYINDLKSLEYLFLSYCEFDYNFKLKLENLKEIHFNLCRKIYFKNNIFLKLQKLILRNCDIYKADSLLKCPLLEKCSLIHGYFENNQLTYDKFIDFSSIEKLKKYKGNAEYFLLINNNNP